MRPLETIHGEVELMDKFRDGPGKMPLEMAASLVEVLALLLILAPCYCALCPGMQW